MTTLVTGGLGYIGAHVVRVLQGAGRDVVVVDDGSTGDARRVSSDIPQARFDLAADDARQLLGELLRRHSISNVIHLAARKDVAESVTRPLWYYEQNVGSVLNLLSAMAESGVRELVFSSSAAVYGDVTDPAVTEDAARMPINPYGETKLVGEFLVRDAARAHDIKAVSLRYFNVGGAGSADLGEHGGANLIPLAFGRIRAGLPPLVYGDDYDTPDGTCIRDFVHVQDLAEAHLVALDELGRRELPAAMNVGTGQGHSVHEVLDEVLGASGSELKPEVEPRRPGDPARVVASATLIEAELGWTARYGLRDIVRSTWEAGGDR